MMGRGTTSVAERFVRAGRGWRGAEAAAVRNENQVGRARIEAESCAPGCPALPRSQRTAGFGPIAAGSAGMAWANQAGVVA